MRLSQKLALAGILALPLTATSATAQCMTITDTAVANGNFTTLVTALAAAGLDGVLDDPGNGRLTVFAPTDDAFAALPQDLLNTLLDPANVDLLTDILLYHVTAGPAFAADVVGLPTVPTLNGQVVDVTVDNQGGVFLDQAQVIITDIVCCNGVIHVIDAVLVPNLQNSLETLAGDPNLSILDSVVNLYPSVQNPLKALFQEFTLFAPQDAAFAAIPANRLTALVNSPIALRDLLKFHIVPGRLYAADVVAAGTLTTITGQTLTVSVSPGGDVLVQGVPVVEANRDTTSGVIHVLGGVMLP
jgi:transforming growth factor-beta-induced protein